MQPLHHFPCSAVLFDLDGVLVDSTQSVERQWRSWAEEVKIPPHKVLEIAHGRRTIEVVELMAPHLDAEAEVRKIEEREAGDSDGVKVMPGAAALLAAIPNGRWCVVTSGTKYLAASRLRDARLPVPKVLIAADDVKQGKPHPEPYLKGAQGLGANPAECLVIEDAPQGIRAARAAGMKVIGLTSTYSASQLGEAHVVVKRLEELAVRNGRSGKLEVSVE
jgi:mannitol-1-/sugar-/sorbitol-6-phosphatase